MMEGFPDLSSSHLTGKLNKNPCNSIFTTILIEVNQLSSAIINEDSLFFLEMHL